MRHAGQLAADEQMKPGDERRAGKFALEIVGGIKEVLPAGLALAAGESAQAVEAARDRAREA
jgi:hypothetical protein